MIRLNFTDSENLSTPRPKYSCSYFCFRHSQATGEVNNSEWLFLIYMVIYGYISLVAMLLDAIVNLIIQSAFIYDGVIFFHVFHFSKQFV